MPVAKQFLIPTVVLVSTLIGACKKDVPTSQAMPLAASVAHSPPASANDHHASPPWFSGSIEQAFDEAKSKGSLVFLYWGAAWCPPCNELKAAVFNKPVFAELMRGFVPVYLDGDTPDAQRRAEDFAVTAYPTIVILDPNKNELLRLGGSIDAEEIDLALAAVRGKTQTFQSALARLEAKNLTVDDCRMLAHTAWELLPEEQWPRQKVLTTLRTAVDVCPANLARERSTLASTLVGMAAMARSEPDASEHVQQVLAKMQTYLDLMLANADTAWAARSFINNRASDLAEWIAGKNPSPVADDWKARWLEAAIWIRSHKDATVDVQLSTYLPMLEFELHERKDRPVSDVLHTTIVAAVERAERDAKTPADRHAVISTAAYLLRQIGLADKSKTMLLAEAEKTDTPFYYYSTLSSQEKALGHLDEAKKWSRKARESAAGRATRLQWIAHDIQLNAKPNGTEERAYLLAIADDFYKLATSLDDGFVGRNRLRAKQIKDVLVALKGDDVDKLFARYKAACASLASGPQNACKAHFD